MRIGYTARAPAAGRPSVGRYVNEDGNNRRIGSRRLGALVPRLTKGLGEKRAGAAHLALAWAEIAGPQLARQSLPVKLSGGPGRPATLRLRATAAAAFEMQHRADELLHKINAFMGYQAVARLHFVQGPLARHRPAAAPPPAPAEKLREVEAKAAAIADPGLRAALTRLGVAIARHNAAPKPPPK